MIVKMNSPLPLRHLVRRRRPPISKSWKRGLSFTTSPLNTSTNNQSISELPLSIYFHYPYCANICTYCCFNVHKKPEGGNLPNERLANAWVKELEYSLHTSIEEWSSNHQDTSTSPRTSIQKPKKKIRSLFFGGGTPSLAPAGIYANTIRRVTELVELEKNAEISLEANPSSTSREYLHGLRDAGITRLSIGMQTLSPSGLKSLNRDHTPQQALTALQVSTNIFPKVSVDLIYGRPGQTLAQWKQELIDVLGTGVQHVSAYQLTVERGTKLWRDVQSGIVQVPNEEELSEYWDTTLEVMKQHGMEQYEVSSFAKEAGQSIHNTGYWKGYDFHGIGPGSHGRVSTYSLHNHDHETKAKVKRWRTWRILHPRQWMDQVESLGHGLRKIEAIGDREMLEEIVLLGLRMNQGCDLTDVFTRLSSDGGIGLKVNDIIDYDAMMKLVQNGFLLVDRNDLGDVTRIKTTDKGRKVTDSVIAQLIRSS